jgi:hypothetical protein
MDYFTEGYIECAVWATSDDKGEPLDALDADLHPDAIARMVADCDDFQKANRADLNEAKDTYHRPDSYLGHDFFLTRNGHGTGFWDRGMGELGERLTKAAHDCGEVYLYVADDGFIHHLD